jgi:hypothetical protein
MSENDGLSPVEKTGLIKMSKFFIGNYLFWNRFVRRVQETSFEFLVKCKAVQ